MDYKFTTDWFTGQSYYWKDMMKMIPNKKDFLEIGSFEGRSTVWLIENGIDNGGSITCIDTWSGSEEHSTLNMNDTEANFDYNISLAKKQFLNKNVIKNKNYSHLGLANLIDNKKEFDFIYIDGSHTSWDTMTDSCMAFKMLRKDGVMVFDDYLWNDIKDIMHRPKTAIDYFTLMYNEQIQVIFLGYQLAIQRIL
jgi:predicted O-methyltransferase YrrM